MLTDPAWLDCVRPSLLPGEMLAPGLSEKSQNICRRSQLLQIGYASLHYSATSATQRELDSLDGKADLDSSDLALRTSILAFGMGASLILWRHEKIELGTIIHFVSAEQVGPLS